MTFNSKKPVKRILIVKPSSLGDIFHAFPAVAALREKFPEAEFDWLICPAFADLLKYSPVKIARIIPFYRRELGSVSKFVPFFIRLLRDLRSEKYDLIVDLQGLLRSALFSFFARGGQVAGFAAPREKIAALFYKYRVDVPEDCIHAVDRNLALVAALGAAAAPETWLPEVPEFHDSLAEKLTSAGLAATDKAIGIVPGARWESKRWAPEFFAEIVSRFRAANPDFKVLIICSAADRADADRILELAGNDGIISLAGKTDMGELIEAVRRCEFIISNDSGPMHIAAALGKTVFALAGPTDPERTGPYGDRHQIFRREELSCLKCLKRICPEGTLACHDLNIEHIASRLSEFAQKKRVV